MGETNTENTRKDHVSHNKNKRGFSLKRIAAVLIIAGLFAYLGSSDPSALTAVQSSHPYGEALTLEEQYANAFGDVQWSEEELSTGDSLITAEGVCSHNGQPVIFAATYRLGGGCSLAFEGLLLDSVPQEAQVAADFISQMIALSDNL